MSEILARLATSLGDRYRVERELGQGGMATVYLAHDLKHDRDVAIKVLHPDLGAALGAERFLSEIRTTARLQHPHILPLLDSGEADGLLYYVMPVVTGETLRVRLERERQLPIPEAVRIAREVAQALDYAHRQGVIHRDIKPENVLLHDGSALVADFGIALAVQTAGGQRMTQTGLSLGTPQYMSPEQAMGERTIDARADQYALGAMTYEMLTGDPPFSGSSVQAIVAKVLSEKPTPIRTLRDTVPVHVEAAVLASLAKLPADRFASTEAFARALAGDGTSALTGAAPAPAEAGRGRGGLGRIVAVASVVAVITGAAGWWAGQRAAPVVEQPELHVQLQTAQRMENSLAALNASALSPDGRFFAYGASDSTGQPGLWVLEFASGRTRRVLDELVVGIAISPNGKLIAVVNPAANQVQVVSLDGGNKRSLGAVLGATAWVDDSTLVQATEGILRYRLGPGATPVIDTVLAPVSGGARPRNITPLDDHRVLFMRQPKVGALPELHVLDLRERRSRPLGINGGWARYVWGGIILYLRDGSLLAQRVDSASLALRGTPEVIATSGGQGDITSFSASSAGLLVLRHGVVSTDRELTIVDRLGKATPVFPERRAYLGPRFSPDGRRVAFIEADRSTTGGDVYIANLASGQRVRVTSDGANRAPEWTADGRSLLMVRADSVGGGSRVLRVSADGGGDTAMLLRRPRLMYELQVTRDQARLLWREDVPGNARDLFIADLRPDATAGGLRTTRYDDRGVALSPDGAWYAYVSNETGQSEVYLSRLNDNGPRWPVSRGGGLEPRWSRTGELFFRRGDSVFVTRPQLGDVPTAPPAQGLFAGPYMLIGFEARWDVSPDGQHFAMVRMPSAQRLSFELVANWEERFLRTHP
ncbi:MAG: protein kinase [Gemmatimonadetes bacterium]|nr:protein kinase [Gemmatimonadota bacterium]